CPGACVTVMGSVPPRQATRDGCAAATSSGGGVTCAGGSPAVNQRSRSPLVADGWTTNSQVRHTQERSAPGPPSGESTTQPAGSSAAQRTGAPGGAPRTDGGVSAVWKRPPPARAAGTWQDTSSTAGPRTSSGVTCSRRKRPPSARCPASSTVWYATSL